mmetsp:Transcript_29638/g.60519  ORF Transcript_29638/g.60519 Transcript_29638/m.60519 type:complete len:187 (+) Transcript_29638:33-593(+)
MSLQGLRESASTGLQKAASAVGIETKSSQDSDALDELSDLCPKLTYQQRMVGWATCFGLGYLITFMSFSLFVDLIEGRPVSFVFVYTLGHLLSLGSSTFLVGPKRQFKNMFDKTRKWTTVVYLITMFITIVVCFVPLESSAKLSILIILLATQFFCSLWYSLSYIPFARRTAKNFLRGAVGLNNQS